MASSPSCRRRSKKKISVHRTLSFILVFFLSLGRFFSENCEASPSNTNDVLFWRVRGQRRLEKRKRKQQVSQSYETQLTNLPRSGAIERKALNAEQNAFSSSKKKNAAVEGLKNALASGLATATCKTVLAPFDTVKTVQQYYKGREALSLLDAGKIVTSRNGGFWNLYAGLGVAVVGAMPSVGLYFGVYSYNKQKLGPWLKSRFGSGSKYNLSDRVLQTLTIGTSAGIGNTIASFSRVPYEVVKQRLQSGEFSSTFEALRQMLFQSPEGALRAFFPLGGVAGQMARDIPYAIVTLLSYEYIREQWIIPVEERRGGQSSAWRNMVCGGVAGGIGSYVTNPMDVIKTRLQTASSAMGKPDVTCTVGQTFMEIWTNEGPSAFLKGSVPRLLHKVPANAIFFVCYEFFRRALRVDDSTDSKSESK